MIQIFPVPTHNSFIIKCENYIIECKNLINNDFFYQNGMFITKYFCLHFAKDSSIDLTNFFGTNDTNDTIDIDSDNSSTEIKKKILKDVKKYLELIQSKFTQKTWLAPVDGWPVVYRYDEKNILKIVKNVPPFEKDLVLNHDCETIFYRFVGINEEHLDKIIDHLSHPKKIPF